jgi:hypothetical protein
MSTASFDRKSNSIILPRREPTLKINRSLRTARRSGLVAMMAVSALGALGISHVASAQAYDPVVFSFATVGDNRQDPKKPDPTTFLANGSPATQGGAPSFSGAVLPQDQEYMQNSAAWAEIQQGITSQGAQLLFFNGDMIYGYGRPIMPNEWTGNPVTWKTAITPALGETVYPDAFFEYIQYAYWRGTVSTMFSGGTYVIPVPGNHETQCSATASPYGSGTAANPNCSATLNGGKQAYVENENAFRANMADLEQDLVNNLRFSNVSGVFATNVTGLTTVTSPGPASTVCTTTGVTSSSCSYSAGTPANNGPISGTQQDLDYSFDIVVPGTSLMLHFAVINTDPSGADATAPSDWLAGDFAAAAARAQAASPVLTPKYFVFGHKAAFTYNYLAKVSGSSVVIGGTPGAGGLDANASTSPNYRNLFWHVIAQYNATYFCGHEHIPNVQQFADPTPGSALTNKPYQVIVGSGGSPFDDTMNGSAPNYTEPSETAYSDRYYAWALVQVHQSGAVTMNLSGFPDTGIGGSVYDLQNYDVPGTAFTGVLQ